MNKKKANLVSRFLKRRRALNRITTSIVIFAVLALSACVPLPIPWSGNSPRYSPEQIAKIREGCSSIEEVASVLGGADIQRLDDRYWVYYWIVDSGMWFGVPLLPISGGDGNLGPIVSKKFILFLEFDEKGILLSKQFGDKIEHNYCTVSGLCLDHEFHVDHNYWGAIKIKSAFTISGSSKDSVPWPALGGDRCVVVLWPDARDWQDLQGLWLAIGNPPQGPPSLVRVPYGSYPLVMLHPPSFFWLPYGSYLALSLPAGQQTVSATDPFDVTFESVENFQCEANQTMYMEIGKISKSRGWLHTDQVSIVLRTIDPETGRQVIAEMPRLLPP